MSITTDDLLDALRSALAKPADGDATTVQDMCASTGQSDRLVRRALHAIQEEGRLEVVMVRRPALSGRMQMVPGYRIKPKAKVKKAK